MLATYMRRMRNNDLEITIAGSSCILQYLYSFPRMAFQSNYINIKYMYHQYQYYKNIKH